MSARTAIWISWSRWPPTGRCSRDIVGLGQHLEELLDLKVDVLTGASLHPALRDRILAESRPL